MIWHPYTIQKGSALPLRIKSAEREFLFDEEGNSYIDAISSWWAVIHGHNHPKIVHAIKEQLDKLDHVLLAGFTHESAEKLSEKLLEFSGNNFKKVFYSDNGSTSVEIALKIAHQYFQNIGHPEKKEILHFSLSYHGDTIGAMSVGGKSYFNENFQSLFFDSEEFHSPNCFDCPVQKTEQECRIECLYALEEYVSRNSKTISTIIMEPLIQAANGMIFYSKKVLKKIREICNSNDILLLFDEVFTGFGRTGEKFAYQFAGVVPDLLTVAKGLSGGSLPIAATLVTEKVYLAFYNEDKKKAFYHGHTMTGSPVGCAASLASIEIFETEKTLESVKELEKEFHQYKESLQVEFGEIVSNPRTFGAVFAIDINEEIANRFENISKIIREKCMEKRVVIRPLGNVVYVAPPYKISKDSLKMVFDAIRYAFTFLTEKNSLLFKKEN